METAIVIPARMGSTRLPGKPLAMIGDAPMIVQVWRRAMAADCGRVIVACAEAEIAEAVQAAGGEAVLTDPAHPSGSDRVHEAVARLDPAQQIQTIINLQGDFPTIDPKIITQTRQLLQSSPCDIATTAFAIQDENERQDPNVVKAVLSLSEGAQQGRALYFTRCTAPSGEGPHYHHIGIYGYRRQALEDFVRLPPAPLEKREKLEQLRALEAGMRIDAVLIDSAPFGVDSPAQLAEARRLIGTFSERPTTK